MKPTISRPNRLMNETEKCMSSKSSKEDLMADPVDTDSDSSQHEIYDRAENRVMIVEFGTIMPNCMNGLNTLIVAGRIECDQVVVGDDLLLKLSGTEYKVRIEGISNFRTNLESAVFGDQVNLTFGTSLSKCELAGTRIYKMPPCCIAPRLPATQRTLREKTTFVILSVSVFVLFLIISLFGVLLSDSLRR